MFKILIVEDDKDINKMVCAYLNANGYEATCCINANGAYNVMYNELFSLIILYIMTHCTCWWS